MGNVMSPDVGNQHYFFLINAHLIKLANFFHHRRFIMTIDLSKRHDLFSMEKKVMERSHE